MIDVTDIGAAGIGDRAVTPSIVSVLCNDLAIIGSCKGNDITLHVVQVIVGGVIVVHADAGAVSIIEEPQRYFSSTLYDFPLMRSMALPVLCTSASAHRICIIRRRSPYPMDR